MHMYTGLVEMSNSPQQAVFPEANYMNLGHASNTSIVVYEVLHFRSCR